MATEQSTDVWAVLEVVGTAIGGVWVGVRTAMSWLTKRESAVKESIQEVKAKAGEEVKHIHDRLHKHANEINANSLSIAVMQTNHTGLTERLSKIERCVEKVNDKQDAQTEILLKIYKEKT